jgi:hypothetical protein
MKVNLILLLISLIYILLASILSSKYERVIFEEWIQYGPFKSVERHSLDMVKKPYAYHRLAFSCPRKWSSDFQAAVLVCIQHKLRKAEMDDERVRLPSAGGSRNG